MAVFTTVEGVKYITNSEAVIAAFRKRSDLTEVVEEAPKKRTAKKKTEE
ncbi:MAG: hypothetical protein MJZ26_12230 [Fibrobacter sp.]|nr:hypothetical protein [Fibrobacter sp.]